MTDGETKYTGSKSINMNQFIIRQQAKKLQQQII